MQGRVRFYQIAVNVFNVLNDTSSGKYWRGGAGAGRIEVSEGDGEMQCFKYSR